MKAGDVFKTMPDDDRIAAITSLARTVRRANYHRLRFEHLRRELDVRRSDLPGDVFWDELSEAVHFEMQAMCAACRTAVDEMLYLIARRHDVPTKRARSDPWESNALVTADAVPSECDVEEIRVLRAHREWFATINAIRNSNTHRGWRQGAGHFDDESIGSAKDHPAANALLVPDVSSLGKKSKPHEWTYHDKTTVDDVVRLAWSGLEEFIRAICEGPWGTPIPAPGTQPREAHPTMLVSLVSPAIIYNEHDAFVPVFSTKELALACAALNARPELELAVVRPSSLVVERPAVTFSLNGATSPSGKLHVLLDPKPLDDGWERVTATSGVEVTIATLTEAGPCMPVSLPSGKLERVFVWRQPWKHQWV